LESLEEYVSILIAVALNDVVILMAGGASGPDDKVVELRNNLAVAFAGPKVGTDVAMLDLRKFTPRLAPNIVNELKRVAFGGVRHAKEQGAAGPMKIGFIGAGFDSHGGFVAGAAYEDGMDKPDAVLVRALDRVAFTAIGGEKSGAQAHFAEKLSALFPDGKRPDDRALLIASLLDAGTQTIRFADPSAGRIQYRALHRGSAAETGFLET